MLRVLHLSSSLAFNLDAMASHQSYPFYSTTIALLSISPLPSSSSPFWLPSYHISPNSKTHFFRHSSFVMPNCSVSVHISWLMVSLLFPSILPSSFASASYPTCNEMKSNPHRQRLLPAAPPFSSCHPPPRPLHFNEYHVYH